MNVHDGHREKLRKKLEQNGIESLEEHEVLELMLFYSIPRRDTNAIGHELLLRFGNISAVLDAPKEELLKVSGIGEHSADFLRLIPMLTRRYLLSLRDSDHPLNSTTQVGNYLKPYFIGQREELVYLLCLDNKYKPLNCTCIHQGSVNSVEVSTRKVVHTALSYNATGVVLAHNHPGGIALPSQEDILTTERIMNALATVGITLIDHIIIAGVLDDSEDSLTGDFVSFADSGMISVPKRETKSMAAQNIKVR